MEEIIQSLKEFIITVGFPITAIIYAINKKKGQTFGEYWEFSY